MSEPRILLVEDDATLRTILTRELTHGGFAVTATGTVAEALRSARSVEPMAALVDLRLPDGDGQDVLRGLRTLDPDLPVVVLTGHGGIPDAVAAMRAGAFDFLQKPASLHVVEETLRRALAHRQLLRENRGLRRLTEPAPDPGLLRGESAAVRELRAVLPKVAGSSASVLVLGESGTGKELVARSVHRLGPRAERPFVTVNCAAIPAALVESELFGHEKGAFTGAERRRTGLFEAADGGTLLLDEVGELPLAIQPALLRAVQFGEVRAVGGERVRQVDVRVIAATHRDLAAEVAAGRFREDLYWRLAAVVVRVPPLRERRDDVALLASEFLREVAERDERALRLAPAAVAALAAHEWPGNVRELQNVVHRLAIWADGDEIGAPEVDAQLAASAPRTSATLPTLDLDALERLAVRAALERHQGDKRKAALELGVALKTLYNMIARHGLKPGA